MSKLKYKLFGSLLLSGFLSLSFVGVQAATTDEGSKPAPADEAKADDEKAAASEDKPKLPTKAERIEQWGDSNIAVRAGNAARAMELGKYEAAIPNFRSLIGFDSDNPEFYIGLYYSAAKSENWGQAYLGLEELFEIKPEYKKKFAKQFAEVLRESGEDDEAVEYEKLITKTSGDGSAYIEKLMKDFIAKSIFEKEKAKPIVTYKPPKRDEVEEDDVHIHKSKYGLTYKNMFQRSESIVIADYKKFEHDGTVSYYAPPKAVFKIKEYIKGPPLNPTLPVRFEFHTKTGGNKPKGWKFKKTMLPKKGSKWIIFIRNAVPVDGMFETYHGSYGRQEFNEDNYDKILRIVERHKGQTR